jgi:hypothetical protein
MKKNLLLLFILLINCIYAQIPSYVPTNGLVAYYPFNGNANDESGNGNNGTFIGNSNLIIDRFGNPNNSFLGGNSYITCPSSVFQFTRSDYFTLSIWFTRATNVSGRLISNENPEGNLFIASFGNNNIGIQFGEQIFFNIDNDLWHHLVYTYSNRNQKIFIDGALTIEQYDNSTGILSYGSPFTIGAKASPAYDKWNGKIDDIGIWNRALTQEEITNLYYADSTCQSLVINTGVLSFNPPTYTNTVTIYPNPANDHITIDCGTLANISGWNIKITNTLGQEVFNQPMNTQQYVVPLNSWSGQGIYFVKIYDAQGALVNTKKIILQ